MTNDIQALIDNRPMHVRQVVTIAVILLVSAIDGFDVLSISLAAPGIAREWGINQSTLGLVLAAELLGMAVGSVLIGRLADRFGRKAAMIGCLILMTSSMYLIVQSSSIIELGIWRVLTGVGIGGMIATIATLAAEMANNRWRVPILAMLVAATPIGSILGSIATRSLIGEQDGWRAIFLMGGHATALAMLLVAAFLIESPAFLAQVQPPDALARVNRILKKLALPALEVLPPLRRETRIAPYSELFTNGTAIMLSLSYSMHIIAFYFILKWVPKSVVDLGFSPESAAASMVWVNIGAIAGALSFGFLAKSLGLKWPLVATLLGTFATFALFSVFMGDIGSLQFALLVAGFCLNAAISGIYIFCTQAFPLELRAAGTGFVLGAGRGAAILAPIAAGILFDMGLSFGAVSLLIGCFPLAAAAIVFLRANRWSPKS